MINGKVSGLSILFSIKTSYKEEYIIRIYRNSLVRKALTALTGVEKIAHTFYFLPRAKINVKRVLTSQYGYGNMDIVRVSEGGL